MQVCPFPRSWGIYGPTFSLTFGYVFWFSAPGLTPRTEPLPLKMSWKIPYRLSLLQTMLWFFIRSKIILPVTNCAKKSKCLISRSFVSNLWRDCGSWNVTLCSNLQSNPQIHFFFKLFLKRHQLGTTINHNMTISTKENLDNIILCQFLSKSCCWIFTLSPLQH